MSLDNIPTASPFNPDGVEAQNKRLYDYLQEGNTINFLQARDIGIGFLNSRIAELRKHQITIHSRYIRIQNIQCKEYSLRPFVDG